MRALHGGAGSVLQIPPPDRAHRAVAPSPLRTHRWPPRTVCLLSIAVVIIAKKTPQTHPNQAQLPLVFCALVALVQDGGLRGIGA